MGEPRPEYLNVNPHCGKRRAGDDRHQTKIVAIDRVGYGINFIANPPYIDSETA